MRHRSIIELTRRRIPDFDRTVADYTHAIELGKTPAAWFHRGNAFAAKGDYAGAIADYAHDGLLSVLPILRALRALNARASRSSGG